MCPTLSKFFPSKRKPVSQCRIKVWLRQFIGESQKTAEPRITRFRRQRSSQEDVDLRMARQAHASSADADLVDTVRGSRHHTAQRHHGQPQAPPNSVQPAATASISAVPVDTGHAEVGGPTLNHSTDRRRGGVRDQTSTVVAKGTGALVTSAAPLVHATARNENPSVAPGGQLSPQGGVMSVSPARASGTREGATARASVRTATHCMESSSLQERRPHVAGGVSLPSPASPLGGQFEPGNQVATRRASLVGPDLKTLFAWPSEQPYPPCVMLRCIRGRMAAYKADQRVVFERVMCAPPACSCHV